jgi:hypothetical protein
MIPPRLFLALSALVVLTITLAVGGIAYSVQRIAEKTAEATAACNANGGVYAGGFCQIPHKN